MEKTERESRGGWRGRGGGGDVKDAVGNRKTETVLRLGDYSSVFSKCNSSSLRATARLCCKPDAVTGLACLLPFRDI